MILTLNHNKSINRYYSIIWKDIYRTFRDNIKFGAIDKKNIEILDESNCTESQLSLYNVLSAFSIFNPDIGYCQGMQAISALLFMYMIEEDVFFFYIQYSR